jgi:hypothetical protein
MNKQQEYSGFKKSTFSFEKHGHRDVKGFKMFKIVQDGSKLLHDCYMTDCQDQESLETGGAGC